MADRIDHFSLNRAQALPPVTKSMQLCMAKDETTHQIALCQVVNIDVGGKINLGDATQKMEFLRRCAFEGYLQLLHFKITEQMVYIFYKPEGPVRTLSDLLSSGYNLSNQDISRIGKMILDSYMIFVQCGVAHQEIE